MELPGSWIYIGTPSTIEIKAAARPQSVVHSSPPSCGPRPLTLHYPAHSDRSLPYVSVLTQFWNFKGFSNITKKRKIAFVCVCDLGGGGWGALKPGRGRSLSWGPQSSFYREVPGGECRVVSHG